MEFNTISAKTLNEEYSLKEVQQCISAKEATR